MGCYYRGYGNSFLGGIELSEAGYKTNNRRIIREFLSNNANRTVSVADVLEHFEKKNLDINITTVYRYMDKLESENQVIKYKSDNGKTAVYQYVEDGMGCSGHLHLKCVNCGKIIHLDCHFMDEIAKHIDDDHGFLIQCKNSLIYGLCENCRK